MRLPGELVALACERGGCSQLPSFPHFVHGFRDIACKETGLTDGCVPSAQLPNIVVSDVVPDDIFAAVAQPVEARSHETKAVMKCLQVVLTWLQ